MKTNIEKDYSFHKTFIYSSGVAAAWIQTQLTKAKALIHNCCAYAVSITTISGCRVKIQALILFISLLYIFPLPILIVLSSKSTAIVRQYQNQNYWKRHLMLLSLSLSLPSSSRSSIVPLFSKTKRSLYSFPLGASVGGGVGVFLAQAFSLGSPLSHKRQPSLLLPLFGKYPLPDGDPNHRFFVSSSFWVSKQSSKVRTRSTSTLHNSNRTPSVNTASCDPYVPPDPDKLASLMPEQNPDGQPYSLYEKCVRRLYLTNLFHPVKLGLQNIERLHNALGNPMDDPNLVLVHVAGTNGKGSTSIKIARTLELAGMNVGLFVSPHIASFRERMQVNHELISEQEVEQFLPMIYDICEKERIPATFFEVTTALAFQFFASRKVNAVVLETGLGGRLDATNVVKRPSVCVITSIGLEHTRILGDTVELIAMEKAGIIKKGAPVVVGPHCPHDTIRKCAAERQASNYYTCVDVLDKLELARDNSSILDGEYVDYDVENAVIARAALKVLEMNGNLKDFPLREDLIQKGTQQRPPCRFEELCIRGPSRDGKLVKVILDVAHNPDAMKYLVKKIQATYPKTQDKIRMVVGFSSDKDLKQCGKTLLDFVTDPSRLHLVEAAHPRAAKLEDLLRAEPELRKSNFDEKDRSITKQVQSALHFAEKNSELLLVCGSVFLMAEAREAIGIDEPRDSKYIAEVAGANLRHGQEFFADKDPEKN